MASEPPQKPDLYFLDDGGINFPKFLQFIKENPDFSFVEHKDALFGGTDLPEPKLDISALAEEALRDPIDP